MASLFRFATGVGIEADDNWLGGTEHTHSTPPYRIVGNKEVRAVPLGYIVDRGSSAFIRPLKRDTFYREGDHSTAEWEETRPYCADPDKPLLTFPMTRRAVYQFIRQADLVWLVRQDEWTALGFPGDPGEAGILWLTDPWQWGEEKESATPGQPSLPT